MTIQAKLQLKQSQSLTLTPEMQQSIKLLQMSAVELQEYIEDELIKNPLLTTSNEEVELPNKAKEQETDRLDDFDTGHFLAGVGAGSNSSFEGYNYDLENQIADKKNLREFLAEQISLEIKDNKDKLVATSLIDFLDEAGYLRTSIEVLASEIGCNKKRLKRVIRQLQSLQPTGIFANSLEECLSLQLQEQNRLDPAMQKLLVNLDLLAKREMKKLCKICGVSSEDLQEMVIEIQALNPKPASDFDNFVTQNVIADIVMKKLPKSVGGGWGVELNPDALPKVLINKRYYTEVKPALKNKGEKNYIKEQLQTAKWLVKALDQRAVTILRVAAEIIKRQNAFFLYGIEYLKPMVFRDIAEAIDMHESTISRVVNGKYIGTPRGVFELRYFFSSSITTSNGGAVEVSSEAVKAKIKKLIEEEDVKKILSDEAISKILKEEGLNVARRTVAKYREAMKIPTSAQRKRDKRAHA